MKNREGDKFEKEMTLDRFNKLPALLKGGFTICCIKPTGMTVKQYWMRRQLVEAGAKLAKHIK